jgi:hypothetical protein
MVEVAGISTKEEFYSNQKKSLFKSSHKKEGLLKLEEWRERKDS